MTAEERSCAGILGGRVQSARPPPPATMAHTTASNVIGVELVRVYLLAVAAAAAFWCYCGNEIPSPPNEAQEKGMASRKAGWSDIGRGALISVRPGWYTTNVCWPRVADLVEPLSNIPHAQRIELI